MQINTAIASRVLFVGEAAPEWLCTERSISCGFYYSFGVCMRRSIFLLGLWQHFEFDDRFGRHRTSSALQPMLSAILSDQQHCSRFNDPFVRLLYEHTVAMLAFLNDQKLRMYIHARVCGSLPVVFRR
jgi:hypothetical protein